MEVVALGVTGALGITSIYLRLKIDRDIRRFKANLRHFINDKKLINTLEEKAIIEVVGRTEYGFKAQLDIQGVTSLEEVQKHKDYLLSLFRAKDIQITGAKGKVYFDVITNEVDNIFFNKLELEPYQLLLGFDLKGTPIIADMRITPHLGVVGASNSGKSKCIEMALSNIKDKANVTMLNCFSDDFIRVDGLRINDSESILDYLQSLLDGEVRQIPLYILIDEYNVLSRIKGIDKAIQDLLSQARHYNIFVIVLMQLGNKEDCKFKNLFNCRLAFRTIEEATIRAFLGCHVDETLLQREFYLYHSELVRGRTYTLDF